jgi:putative salt-induced outer membrane protein YdiY
VLRKVEWISIALITLIGLSAVAVADQITLKNGDRLTGAIVKSDGKTLILHTEFAGDVTLQFPAITQIKSDQELHITTTDKKTIVGPVTATDGNLAVATKTQGEVDVPAANVAMIRDDAEQSAYDKSLHPGLRHGWNGGANVGFSLARGNSETTNLALAINAVHPTLNDKTTIFLTSIDTTNQLATPSTVANLITAGIEYDHNINPKAFGFVSGNFMSNALQDLDLRGVYTGGLGYHAIKSDKTTLDLQAGINYTHETYSNGPQITPPTVPPALVSYGVTNRYAALTLGEELTHKAGKTTVITESFYIYPDLSGSYGGQYRMTFNFGTVTKISKWLGWQNQFNDLYVTNPPTGTKDNDVIYTTGLNFSFAQH